MANALNLAAIDLGASSGRVMLARIYDDKITVEKAHRFPNGPVRVFDHIYWDVLRLFEEIKIGLGVAGQMGSLSGLGLDTWGVDYALLDGDDQLIGNPFHYRDPRTNGVMDQVFELVNREEIFNRTGLQFMQLNTLYQLFSMRESSALRRARSFLMMPDLFNFWLTGRKANEFSNATTTQFYNPHLNAYDLELLFQLGLPTDIYPEILPSGSILGPLIPTIEEDTGLGAIPVIAPACHDTGSAVAAAPIQSSCAAYISSGTWSLVGVEVKEPVITPQSLAYNFTNEGGAYGTIRLLKNVAGLWLVQECKRVWANQGRDYSWVEITKAAREAPHSGSLVDPDHPDFLNPSNMPAAIRGFCTRTGQDILEGDGAVLRCIFESLALKYRWVIKCLEELLGYPLEVIHIIGGGSQNELLCQLTADATGKPVMAGPVEATAIGNALVQAISLGYFDSLEAGRRLVRRSFPMKEYFPQDQDWWEDAEDLLAFPTIEDSS
jgi:rhamnulokinase